MGNLAEAIRTAIQDSGLMLIEISRLSGVDVGQLSRFQNGKRTVTIETADKILSALGRSVRLEAPKPNRAAARTQRRKRT
jgi:transcriptional regulator with XRE-family HTH domain